MKDRHFWFKYVCLFALSLVCFSLGAGFMAAHFYAEKSNRETLEELKVESELYRNEAVSDLRILISDLISLQKKEITQQSLFSMLMTIDPSSGAVLKTRPESAEKKIQVLDNLPLEQLKEFPVAFYPLKFSWKKNNHVALLVNVDRIQSKSLPKDLSKGKILLGVLTENGLLKLSRFLMKKGFNEAFIIDRKQDWFQFHSNIHYAGRALSPGWDVLALKKRYSNGWNLALEKSQTLSAGIPLGVSDSYLVLNKKMAQPRDFFISSLKMMSLIIFAFGILFFIPCYLLIHPLLGAYRYLARLFNRYALSRVFPVPEYHGYNGYINDLQPNLKKLFWKLREERLFNTADTSVPEAQSFSELLGRLSKKVSSSALNVHLDVQDDAPLPNPSDWLELALLEVLKNAKESMNSKGEIQIRTFKQEARFCCVICDQGPGMNADECHLAFDAYFTTKEGSSGLGLTLAVSALSRMGGEIALKNLEGGRGLEASITLPLDILLKKKPSQGKSTQAPSFLMTEFK